MAYAPPRDPTEVLGRRIVAYLIDFAIVFGIGFVIVRSQHIRYYDGLPRGTGDPGCDLVRASTGFTGHCLQVGDRAYTWTGAGPLLGVAVAGCCRSSTTCCCRA
jgi:hypothetical protein